MQLRPIQLAERVTKVKCLTLADFRRGDERVVQALYAYEAECASDTWRNRCAAKIAARVADLDNQLRAAKPEDRFELLGALRTYRTALSALTTESAPSLGRAQRLALLREQAIEQPRLRLVR